jgi:signal recognition particle subunit SEC65
MQEITIEQIKKMCKELGIDYDLATAKYYANKPRDMEGRITEENDF